MLVDYKRTGFVCPFVTSDPRLTGLSLDAPPIFEISKFSLTVMDLLLHPTNIKNANVCEDGGM